MAKKRSGTPKKKRPATTISTNVRAGQAVEYDFAPNTKTSTSAKLTCSADELQKL